LGGGSRVGGVMGLVVWGGGGEGGARGIGGGGGGCGVHMSTD